MGYLVFGFIVALPFNSGFLDFVFSPDIVLTVALLLLLHFVNGSSNNLLFSESDPTLPRQPSGEGSDVLTVGA
jgi:hypothetical protein